MHHTTPHNNTLQHTATHCNILQHTATYSSPLQRTVTYLLAPKRSIFGIFIHFLNISSFCFLMTCLWVRIRRIIRSFAKRELHFAKRASCVYTHTTVSVCIILPMTCLLVKTSRIIRSCAKRAPHSAKRALYSAKRALLSAKRASSHKWLYMYLLSYQWHVCWWGSADSCDLLHAPNRCTPPAQEFVTFKFLG